MDYTNPNDFWRPEPDMYKDLTDEERVAASICHIAGVCIAFFIMFALCAMCSSCTMTKYVTVPEYHTDTLIQTKVVHDSIHVKDSTHVEWKDSIIKIEHWHTEYVDHSVHDTTYISKTDTVPKPYPVETIKEIEKPLAWWQKTLMWMGGLLIAIFLIWVWRTK